MIQEIRQNLSHYQLKERQTYLIGHKSLERKVPKRKMQNK